MSDKTNISEHEQAVRETLDSFGIDNLDDGISGLLEFFEIKGADGKVLSASDYNGAKHGSQIVNAANKGYGPSTATGALLKTYVDSNGKDLPAKFFVEGKLHTAGIEPADYMQQAKATLQFVNNAPEVIGHLNAHLAELDQPAVTAPSIAPIVPAPLVQNFVANTSPENAAAIQKVQSALDLNIEGQQGLYSEQLVVVTAQKTAAIQAELGIENPDGVYSDDLHAKIGAHLEEAGLDGNSQTANLREFHASMAEFKETENYNRLIADQKSFEAARLANQQVAATQDEPDADKSKIDASKEDPKIAEHETMVQRWTLGLTMLSNFIPGLKPMMQGMMEKMMGMLEQNGQSMGDLTNMFGADSGAGAFMEAAFEFMYSPDKKQAPKPTAENTKDQAATPQEDTPIEEASKDASIDKDLGSLDNATMPFYARGMANQVLGQMENIQTVLKEQGQSIPEVNTLEGALNEFVGSEAPVLAQGALTEDFTDQAGQAWDIGDLTPDPNASVVELARANKQDIEPSENNDLGDLNRTTAPVQSFAV